MALSPNALHGEIKNDVSPDPMEGSSTSRGKRKTVPSLSAVAILNKAADMDNIFLLGDKEIGRRLSSGFLLHDKEKKIAEQKFWVCEKLDKNCVLVLSKTMDITWSEDSRYWDYIDVKEECFDGKMDIPVAKLKEVCWLDVRGKFETMVLSPLTTYEVSFVVKMGRRSSGWENPVSVSLCLPDKSMRDRTENLSDKPKEEWIHIPIGRFVTSPKNVGELSFQLKETLSLQWKSDLLIKGVLLQPQD